MLKDPLLNCFNEVVMLLEKQINNEDVAFYINDNDVKAAKLWITEAKKFLDPAKTS